ncbi:MAG: hypothetical protein JOZ22_03500 [Acidobacteriia bacterium]|nr:hypothetical protein [Terriglobia bacterium]MBV9743074.1 hypothetical protein [Terriglobia bacterium]
MRKIILTITLAAAGIAAQAATFNGLITDTMCAAEHRMMKDRPAGECVRMCAKGQYAYALYDGTNVFKLSDQKTPAKFTAQRVRVTGTLDEKNKTIKVSSIEAIGEN